MCIRDSTEAMVSIDVNSARSTKGKDIESIILTHNKAIKLLGNGSPVAILMKTEMGNGVDFMMNTHAWHGKAPNDEQLEIIYPMIDPEHWAIRFKRQPNDVQLVKDVAKESNL